MGDVPYYGATGQVGWIDEYLFDEELVLLGEDGAPFLDSGKAKAYRICGKSWVNNHAHVLRAKPGLLNSFLMYQLNCLDYRPYVSGTTRLKLPQGPMKRIPLLVPPEAEQRKIVAEIETQFTRLDSGVGALRRVQANLKRYRAAVLRAACAGDLVETEVEIAQRHDRPCETGEQIVGRILVERRQRRTTGRKYKEPVVPDAASLPVLPAGWAWATVDQLAASEPNAITDGPFGSNLKTEHYTASGPRVIRLQNIGDAVFKDEEAYVSHAHFNRLPKHHVFAHDLVIAALGESPPRSCIVPEWLGAAMVKADCIRMKPHPLVSVEYLNIALNSDPVRKRTKETLHGVGRPRLNLGEIKSIAVPLPPRAEQERVVIEVERRLSQVDAATIAVSSNLQRATRLRQSILQQAFSGMTEPSRA